MSAETIVRIDPLQKNTAVANDTLQFDIPLGVYDLSTLRLWLLGSVTGSTNLTSMPRDIETLIEILEIYVDGEKIQYIPGYNHIFRMIYDYDFNEIKQRQRALLSNSLYIVSGLNASAYNVSSTPFCMSEWIGFLGCKQVIDTRKLGRMTISITFAPNQAILSDSTSATYSLADIHLTMKKLPDSTNTANVINYDRFKSILQFNTSYTQSTQLNVQAKKLDYVVATFLPTDYRTRAISTSTNFSGSSYYFCHGSGAGGALGQFNFNFRLNNNNLIAYYPSVLQCSEFMQQVFPKNGMLPVCVTTRSGTTSFISHSALLQYMVAMGIVINMDASNGVDLQFETILPPGSANNRSNYSLFVAKTTSTLVFNPSTGKYDVFH
jgi:hypothetical protein